MELLEERLQGLLRPRIALEHSASHRPEVMDHTQFSLLEPAATSIHLLRQCRWNRDPGCHGHKCGQFGGCHVQAVSKVIETAAAAGQFTDWADLADALLSFGIQTRYSVDNPNGCRGIRDGSGKIDFLLGGQAGSLYRFDILNPVPTGCEP